jgi:hypothetical protein
MNIHLNVPYGGARLIPQSEYLRKNGGSLTSRDLRVLCICSIRTDLLM